MHLIASIFKIWREAVNPSRFVEEKKKKAAERKKVTGNLVFLVKLGFELHFITRVTQDPRLAPLLPGPGAQSPPKSVFCWCLKIGLDQWVNCSLHLQFLFHTICKLNQLKSKKINSLVGTCLINFLPSFIVWFTIGSFTYCLIHFIFCLLYFVFCLLVWFTIVSFTYCLIHLFLPSFFVYRTCHYFLIEPFFYQFKKQVKNLIEIEILKTGENFVQKNAKKTRRASPPTHHLTRRAHILNSQIIGGPTRPAPILAGRRQGGAGQPVLPSLLRNVF